jgi:pimeloyl-ACP methyl ester carboxylesterase
LVFVHGGAGDRSIWAPQLRSLSVEHRCLAVDLRGYGESDAVPPYGVRQQAADLSRLLEDLGRPAVVVGHSLGGIAALLLNEMMPDLVSGVVVIDSPLMREGLDPRHLATMLRDEGSTEPLVRRFFRNGPTAVDALAVSAIRRSSLGVVSGHLEDSVVDASTLQSIVTRAAIRPFLAIWPAGPNGEGPRGADPVWLAEIAPSIRQEHLEGRHFVHLEQAERANAILRDFASSTREAR